LASFSKPQFRQRNVVGIGFSKAWRINYSQLFIDEPDSEKTMRAWIDKKEKAVCTHNLNETVKELNDESIYKGNKNILAIIKARQ
jgi:hypothetical protein